MKTKYNLAINDTDGFTIYKEDKSIMTIEEVKTFLTEINSEFDGYIELADDGSYQKLIV